MKLLRSHNLLHTLTMNNRRDSLTCSELHSRALLGRASMPSEDYLASLDGCVGT